MSAWKSGEIKGVLYRVPTGEPIAIPKRHLAVFGVTRDSGKTTFIESAILSSGLRAVTFRTKRGELGFEQALPLPLFFDEKGLTHWKALEGLISATLEEKVSREPGVREAIISVCQNPTQAKTLSEIHTRVRQELQNPRLRDGFKKGVLVKLDAYLQEVLPQLEKLRDRFTTKLEMPREGTYVEDLVGLSDELQNLFVASLMRKIYEEMSGVICVLPEVWRFLPQDRGSPVKWIIEKYVREMGAVDSWLWIDAQDLRGVDKKHLRSIDIRLFGRQPDPHEIEEVLKALPLPKNLKPSITDVMTLKVGHFYAKLKDRVELVYVRPNWLPEEAAVRIAKGELLPDSEEIQKYKPQEKKEDSDLVYKEMFEKELEKTQQLSKKVEQLEIVNKNLEENQISPQQLEAIKQEADLNGYSRGRADAENEPREPTFEEAAEKVFTKDFMAYISTARGFQPASTPINGNKNVALETTGTAITVTETEPRYIELSTEKSTGKILLCVIEMTARVPAAEQSKTLFLSADIQKAALEHGWNIPNKTMGGALLSMVRDGLLVKEDNKYRLPSKAKVSAK